MSLSPRYADRVRLPHQPRPPEHWPYVCVEVPDERLRVFLCGRCAKRHEFQRDDLGDATGLACYGDGTSVIRDEPRREA